MKVPAIRKDRETDQGRLGEKMNSLRLGLVASVALLPSLAWAQNSISLGELSVAATTPVGGGRRAAPVRAAPAPRIVAPAPIAPQARIQPRGVRPGPGPVARARVRALPPAPPVIASPAPLPVDAPPTLVDGVDRNKIAQNTFALGSQDVSRVGFPSTLRALDERIGSISINNSQGNPFQPAITFRGFEASPLGGSPQGLAVYVNGSRFNTAFGDTVQWDLIPDVAIDRIDLQGSNPAFGLNALGGSLAVSLKNGFTYQGSEVNLLGGSFGRGAVNFQHGQRWDNIGVYIAGSRISESGWRKRSPSVLNNIYADVGLLAEKGEFHANFIGATNNLTGNGTSPVELLRNDYRDVFTYPDATRNDFYRVQVTGNYELTPTVSVQGNAYAGVFQQRTFNGDAADVENCEADDDFVCLESSTGQALLRDPRTGAPIRSDQIRTANFGAVNPIFSDRFDEGGPYAFLNRTNTNTENFGTTIQTTITERLPFFDMPNRLVIGGSYDAGRTRFSADNQIGGLTLDRGFSGPGFTVRSDDNVITPVGLFSSNDYGGIYFSNITDVTPNLTVTLNGRYNIANVVLRDRLGVDLNGDHLYQRFNPGIGAAYKIIPEYLIAYGSYNEANRAPTPAELSCADETRPCSLTNFFVGDPPLKQVVARTVEAGLRGRVPWVPVDFAYVNWKAGYFRTRNDDDIQFVRAGQTIGRAFFQNVGSTQREGAEAGLSFTGQNWTAFVDYAYIDATFESPLTLNNPLDESGNTSVIVRPGNKIPSISPHQVKLGAQYYVTPEWRVGALARYAAGKFLVGDEANTGKTTGDYFVIGFNTSYRVTENIELYGYVENALNRKYATFGTFSAVGEVPIITVPNASINRSLAPGTPVAAFGGMRILW